MDKEKDSLVIFGINPVLEKARSRPSDILEILVARKPGGPAIGAILEEARRSGLQVRDVDSSLLDRLTESRTHQGVAARIAPYAYHTFDELVKELSSEPSPSTILILDGLTDPRNVGALLRSAEAAGVRHVVLPKDRSVAVTPVVAKTSSGAVNHLKIYRVGNLRRVLEALKASGWWIVGLAPAAKECLYDRSYPAKVAVVLGSEGGGMRSLIQRECDFLVSIPMAGKIASLNVAVAGALCLYELVRQRTAAKDGRA